MSDDIKYCANGCSRKQHDETIARHATHGRLCTGCYDRLSDWLRDIPDRYAIVPQFVLPSTKVDSEPGAKAGKRAEPPAPVRLAALDLLDQRHGRKWQGLVPVEDMRGAIGVVHAWASYIRAGRNTSTRLKPTVSRETHTILTSLEWLANDPAITEAYAEIKKLHRDLGNAIGEYPPRSVGSCPNDPNEDGNICGGPLMPTRTGEVRCPACHRHWDHHELRFLGRNIEQEQTA